MARGNKLAFLAEERAVVDGEEHAHRGFVDGDWRQWFGHFKVADGVANLKFFESDNGTDVSAVHVVGLNVSHSHESVQLLDACAFFFTIAMHHGNVHPIGESAAMHAPHGNTARIAAII